MVLRPLLLWACGSGVEERGVPDGEPMEARGVSMDERALRAFCSRAYMWIAATEDMLMVVFG